MNGPKFLTRKYRLLRKTLPALLMVSSTLWAQHYSFKSYTQEQGLTNLSASSLLQDRNGFIWVGTNNGVFWYDGKSFHEFAASELVSKRIVGLNETPDGTLWIATQLGLYRRIGVHVQKVDAGEAIEITGGASIGGGSITSDSSGRVYLATRQGLLRVQENGQNFSFEWLSRVPVDSVGLDADGKIWFGCGESLCQIDFGRVIDVRSRYRLPAEHWSSIIADGNGNLWIRSPRRLFELVKGSGHFVAQDAALLGSGISYGPLYRSSDGRVMVAMNTGLAISEDDHWRLVNSSRGLAGDSVANILRDREGSLWIGLHGTGLMRWLGYQQWESWTKSEGLSSDMIWAIRRDAKGNLWVGTENGLNEMRQNAGLRKSWIQHKELEGLKVRAVATGQNGEMWAGTVTGRIFRFDRHGKLIATYGSREGLTADSLWALLVDGAGNVWAGTTEGLFCGQPVRNSHSRQLRFRRVQVPFSDQHENFYQAILDHRGWLWAPGSRGLACLRNGKWQRYRVQDGLRTDATYGVSEASDGSIWIYYAEPFGVTRMVLQGDNAAFQHYTRENSLRSDKVYFVGGTTQGLIFVGTDRGVDMLQSGTWRHFGRPEGLVWEDTDTNSFLAGTNGDVWIGTSRGLAHFQPPTNSIPEPGVSASLLSVQFGDTGPGWNALDPSPLEASDFSRIEYADRAVHIKFTTLTFIHEDQVQFRYRLTGSAKGWFETDQRESYFLGLAPGQYTFEVQARTAGGNWGPAAKMSFAIASPFWDTFWFRLLVALGIGVIALAVWKWRMMRVLRQQTELEKQVVMRTSELRSVNEQLMKAREAAESANRAKSAFLANVSHEIRTPMNGILGMTDLALSTESATEQKDYLAMVKTSGEALLTVINELLDYAKAEAGKFELDPRPFETREVVEEAVKSIAAAAHAKRLSLACSIDEDVPQYLIGDDMRVRQVLINLVSNAIKFTDKGNIEVLVKLVHAEAETVRLQFSVHDTGIGIPADKLISIFAPFEQVDASTTRNYGGTGLGLAICRKIADLMGGRVWAESTLGVGSTFHFIADFPLAQARDTAGLRSDQQTLANIETVAPHRSMKILLAEDNPVNQMLAVALLNKLGHTVVVAGNGRAAVAALENSDFDVVLMDVQMPEMDGFEATATIRANEQETGQHIPIIAMTAHAMTRDRERCLQAGMDAYISKPVRSGELATVIAELTSCASPN